jgi:hypothetical protein
MSNRHVARGLTPGLLLLASIGGVITAACAAEPPRRATSVGRPAPGTITTPISAGYEDYPEGATPVPTAAPDAIAAARPLRVATRDVPIDRLGLFELEVGQAILPNGVLTEASMELGNTNFESYDVADSIHMQLRPIDPPGPILWNRYFTAWYPGTTTVAVVVRFEVTRFEPGTVLELRNIVVK